MLPAVSVVEAHTEEAVAYEPHWEKQQYAKEDVQGIHLEMGETNKLKVDRGRILRDNAIGMLNVPGKC